MFPLCFGLVGEPWSGFVSQASFCLVLGLVDLCSMVVYHILNHLIETVFHLVYGDVLCA